MGTRQSGWVRMGFRRLGQASSGGGGGISLIQGSSSVNVAGGSGPTATLSVPNNGITNAMLAQAAALTLKGNNTGGLANVADLTVAQVATLLGLGTAAFSPAAAFDVAGAAAAAQAASQPLNAANLSAIAALTTTAYGRNLLTLVDQAALTAAIANATTALAGNMSPTDKSKLDKEMVVIDTATLTAQTTYTGPGWSANKYRELQFTFTNHSGSATGVITLTGLTAPYSSAFFTTDGGSVLSASSAAWQATPNAPGWWRGNIVCVNDGNPRAYEATAWLGTVPYHQRHAGVCNDTTHDVTNLVATFNAAVSGTFVLRGLPT